MPKPSRRKPGGDYFPEKRGNLELLPSGCALLDCVLGGGWPLGRVANIVGDKSSGKTLLAIEACANFAHVYPKGKIWYRETEAAFDEEYAVKLGLPVDNIDFGPEGSESQWETIEDIFEDMDKHLEKVGKQPGLYIIDSLDALSSRAELERGIDEGSYGLEKQKVLGRLFREKIRKMRASRVCFLIISQVRDRIGFGVGEKQRRTGGKSLDFYTSQILWLTHLKTFTQTRAGVKRATAIRILAKCKKNKITMPFRECEFNIRFGYGIDDVEASVEWLQESKRAAKVGIENVDKYLAEVADLTAAEYRERARELRKFVLNEWEEIDSGFMVKAPKYS